MIQRKVREKNRNEQRVWKKSYLQKRAFVNFRQLTRRNELQTHLRKSLCGCAECTVHHALTVKLNMVKTTTRKSALCLALYPTATKRHATSPETLTSPCAMPLWPLKTKPRKRKTRRTRPKSWKYFLRSVSLTPMLGMPTRELFFWLSESESAMRRPPMTERLRRKKVRSKMRPYPKPCVMTTPRRPPVAYSG